MKGKKKLSAGSDLSDAVEDAAGTHLEDTDDDDDVGEEEEEEELEEEEDEEEEEEEEEEGEERDKVGVEEERPKLDEGFYEIEAIRRKRFRKGQLQYLIKWRGWPEAANTWEPLENLLSCSDMIDAFEERWKQSGKLNGTLPPDPELELLQSGKGSRKRKRKHGILHTQPKKKQPRSLAVYNLSGLQATPANKTLHAHPINRSSLVDLSSSQFMGSGHKENNGIAKNVRSGKQADQNGSTSGLKKNFGKKSKAEYDPKLSELRVLTSNSDGNADEPAIHLQEGMVPPGDDLANGLPKTISGEPVQNDRCIGAKRRKSGSVKRFQKDPTLDDSAFLQPIEGPTLTGGNSACKPVGEESRDTSAITKIIKPISLSASSTDDTQDVTVTFLATRADGKEVIVDNGFLKANHPLMLINYYEQHLKYIPPA